MARLLSWISSLRLAIVLLLLISLASGLGTALPQQEASSFYTRYDAAPWLGVVNGTWIQRLQLDHVYSSAWFLGLLAWLGLALILCSWRRQWPALQQALRWVDYREPRQLSKMALSERVPCDRPQAVVPGLAEELRRRGWQVRLANDRLAARRGLAGRIGPLLVHTGLIVLMVGAVWGSLAGARLERYLAPGHDIEMLDASGSAQVTLRLDSFSVERDPAGRPEQFRSMLRLWPGAADAAGDGPTVQREISVNHPLRYRGMTVYQADWSLAAITIRFGNSPPLQIPLQPLEQLGDQVWGVVLPTQKDGSDPVLLALTSEQGPVQVFGGDGQLLGSLAVGPGGDSLPSLPLRVQSVLPASGLLFKRDPGVPLVYGGFGVVLIGGGLSVIATRQIWAIADASHGSLYLAGLCNRNLTGLADDLPVLTAAAFSRAGGTRGSPG
ncbi:cytochrome C biogenesis protein CcsB [Synechococcus sp. RSCCF101]|uniref:cytochrome c biogenesis protein ResB n=1 Tax=Synechococcus sp. RSCCF101 TaxID=2511069 RepID=UPI0012481434|nr:cytochrome C biogenesis protein CcsB [Synechococcus sp. RSCCF101]